MSTHLGTIPAAADGASLSQHYTSTALMVVDVLYHCAQLLLMAQEPPGLQPGYHCDFEAVKMSGLRGQVRKVVLGRVRHELGLQIGPRSDCIPGTDCWSWDRPYARSHAPTASRQCARSHRGDLEPASAHRSGEQSWPATSQS